MTAVAESPLALVWTIWRLAWPVILTMSIESLVFLVDMLMVGRLGPLPVAGVGVATQILFAVNTVIFAVGTGTVAVVARCVGAGDVRQASVVAAQSLLAVLALVFVVMIPALAVAPWVVDRFGVEPEVAAIGVRYLRVVLLALPLDAVFLIVAFALRGAGDTRTPLLIGVVVAAVNVVANYLFIFGAFGFPALGAMGAAVGTAIAYSAGATLAFLVLQRGDLVLQLPRRWWRPDLSVMRRVLAIGTPAAIEHMLIQIGFVLYFALAAVHGTSAVAAYVIGVRILGLSFLPGIGFSVAAGALVGQNLGARQPDQARRSGWGTTWLSMALMSIGGVVIFVAARPIAALFVDDPEVVARTVVFIQVLAAVQPLMALDFTLGGALRGAGDTRFPLYVVLIGFYACRLSFGYAATHVFQWDLFWLWFALVPDYIVRCLLKTSRFQSNRWETIRV